MRHGNPLSLVYLDVDDFKRVNDEMGHQEGDRVLGTASRAERSGVRTGTAELAADFAAPALIRSSPSLHEGHALDRARGLPHNAQPMAKVTLTYFDFSGSRGEDCRLALHLAGVDFEDRRLSRPQWMALKPETPFGNLPLLELEGKQPLAQSNAILGYIGTKYGLLPDDAWEAARHLAVLESVEEVRVALGPSGKLTDEEQKRRAREELVQTTLLPWARNVSQQILGPFLAGERISVADLKVNTLLRSFATGVMDYIPRDVFVDQPKLLALGAAVDAHPKIVEWRARH